jgi:hypothetical protein
MPAGNISTDLNPQHPDRDDRPEHRQAGNRPTRRVHRAVGFGPVDHLVVPVGHAGLPELASGK